MAEGLEIQGECPQADRNHFCYTPQEPRQSHDEPRRKPFRASRGRADPSYHDREPFAGRTDPSLLGVKLDDAHVMNIARYEKDKEFSVLNFPHNESRSPCLFHL